MYVNSADAPAALGARVRSLDREDSMSRYYPGRDTMNPNRHSRLLAFFWVYLATLFLISFWP